MEVDGVSIDRYSGISIQVPEKIYRNFTHKLTKKRDRCHSTANRMKA